MTSTDGEQAASQPAGAPAGAAAGDPADDTASTLQPLTASVLVALAGRGVELPGIDRPTGGVDGGEAPRYTVVEQVARGGMGVVLRVRDQDLRRELAMKVLDRAGRAPDALASDPRDVGRFLEEAQVTGQLDHPGVPPIHELGLGSDGRLFFTMKLVRGVTFADVIRHVRGTREDWTVTRALGVVLKVCEALAYAHHKGVIHRDIKPANIMVGRFGETYVMDWGLAKVLDGQAGGESRTGVDSLVSRSIVFTDRRAAAGGSDTQATLDGDVIGTPAYMAPEQARGDLDAMGPHSDIYAVGTLLYQLLSGQAPYLEPGVRVSPHSVLRWVIDGPPKPLAELAPDAPAELVAIIDKAMHREPGLRYATMLDLAGDLQAFIEDRVVRAYQSGAWAEARKWVVRNKPLAAAAGLLMLVTVGALGAISWIQASGRAAVEERNLLLGQSNSALEDANLQLGQANVDLAQTNVALDQQRSAAEAARVAAEQAREQAQTNAELARDSAARAAESARIAEANERLARVESYAANMSAAVVALDAGAGGAARRHLAACPEDLRGWDWRHLSLRADPSLHVWSGGDSLLQDVDHSPDGSLLAVASGPFGNFGPPHREMRILDAESGATLVSLPSAQTVRQVEFSPDGSLLAHADDRTVSLWNVDRGRPHVLSHRIEANCWELQFLDDSRLLVLSVDEDRDTSRLDIWNTDSDVVEFSRESDPALTAVAATPDGRGVVIGRSDFSVERWSLPDGELLWALPPADLTGEQQVELAGMPGIMGLAIDARGERVVVTDRDRRVRLLDAGDGTTLALRELAEGAPVSSAFHPDGPWVVLGDSSGSVRFLDAETLDQLERLSGHDQVVRAVSISADGDQLVSAGMLGDLRIWDGRPGAASLMIANRAAVRAVGASAGQRCLEWSPDGRLIAWTPTIRAVLVTDALTGEVLYRLSEASSAVSALHFSVDGARLLVNTEAEGLLSYDVADGRLVSRVPTGAYADWAAFDPTGSLLAEVMSRTDTRVDLRLVQGGLLAASLDTFQEEPVTDGAFTPDSLRLVTCAQDGTLRTWDLSSRQVVQAIQGDDDFLTIELFDGGRRAVTTTLDPTRSALSVWDLAAGELLVRHPAQALTLRGSLHPDGQLWAGSRQSGSPALFDLERGEMFSLRAGEFPVTHLRFDPTGARLAALDRAGNLFLYDTRHPRDRAAARHAAARLSRHLGAARLLVGALFDEHLLMKRVLAALQEDMSLGADLREAAVREARVRGDNGAWVVERLWARLLPADLPDASLATAPETASLATALLPLATELRAQWQGYMEVWEPLAWALYRTGRLDEAAAMIPGAIDTGYSFAPRGPQAIFAVQALVAAARGDSELAASALARAREEYADGLAEAPGDSADLAVTARLIAAAEAQLGEG